ncbi:class I SAM-dependent methyltransferase [Populibacterium corticicola]|uniref:Class I SAM-dependent methyltransferase n=1 Tax=Populibacterium corticicola TaxID=1812826 RepID=A0ABW5XFN0_9MICO
MSTAPTSPIRYILFPGRHHLVTAFQVRHLRRLVAKHPGSAVVWAITSANHGGTQRNPIPGTRRLGLIEAVAAAEALPSLTFLIANRQPKPDFAHYVIEEIRTQTGGTVTMTSDNTLVACSTPAVIADYERLGFSIDAVELGALSIADEPSPSPSAEPSQVAGLGALHAPRPVGEGDQRFAQPTETERQDAERPWEIVEKLIENGISHPDVAAAMHPVAFEYYRRYGLADVIAQVYGDPLIDSDDGDITVTRDYATYRAAFEDNAWRKVGEFAHLVRPGRIVDVGCATGQTIKLLSERPELFESDFYGVEVARPLYEICLQRASNGEFGDANVFFHQRNILQTQLFEPNSLDTVITMALTHEIESYLGREALEEFCAHVYSMLRPGGVWINYDVVGPDRGDELVFARFNTADGDSASGLAEVSELARVNTRARFERFVHDFRRAEGDGMTYRSVAVSGPERAEGSSVFGAGAFVGSDLVELRRADLYDFLAKKDYVDSWLSEAHERFCFFSPREWTSLLERHGFVCTTDSRPIRNPWLIENRFDPAAQVFRRVDALDAGSAVADDLVPDDWSWTNVLLIAEKPHD